MIGTKTEEMGSRKKLLAPVVVLLLCVVSLTGAAYAYSSSMTNVDNKATSDILSLDLATGDVSADVTTGDNGEGIFVFTDDFTYSSGTKSDVIKYETKEGFIAKYKIQISGDAAFNTFNVSSSNIGTLKPMENGDAPANTKTMAQLFTFTYTVKTADESAVKISATALGIATTLDAVTPEMVKDTIYTVVITAVPITEGGVNAGTVETVSDVSVPGAHTAQSFKGYVANLSFSITMVASQVTA